MTGEPDDTSFYRTVHKTIRTPLPNLRVLAGAMIVHPDGDLEGIRNIDGCGVELVTHDGIVLNADDLCSKHYHYAIGSAVRPCWTEEEE